MKRRTLIAKKNQSSGIKEKAALIHASAAKKQADTQLAQTRLAAIDSARKMGVDDDLLQRYMEETLGSLFLPVPAADHGDPAGENTGRRAAAERMAAEQLSMMSAGYGASGGTSVEEVSTSERTPEVIEVHKETDETDGLE